MNNKIVEPENKSVTFSVGGQFKQEVCFCQRPISTHCGRSGRMETMIRPLIIPQIAKGDVLPAAGQGCGVQFQMQLGEMEN